MSGIYTLKADGFDLADKLVRVDAQPAGSAFAAKRASFVSVHHALEIARSLSLDPRWSSVTIDVGITFCRVINGEPQPHPRPDYFDPEDAELWNEIGLPPLT